VLRIDSLFSSKSAENAVNDAGVQVIRMKQHDVWDFPAEDLFMKLAIVVDSAEV